LWFLLSLTTQPGWTEDTITLQTLEEAALVIQENWVGETSEEELYRAALKGMLDHLDAQQGHPGNALTQQGDPLPQTGWREGIGFEYLALPGHGMLVTQVFSNSPADKAGLLAGETVTAMGTWSLAGRSRGEIHTIVQTQNTPGTVLEITSPEGDRRRVKVQRGAFQVAPVRSLPTTRAPSIRIHHFSSGSSQSLRAAIPESHACLVLDVRDNPGGAIDETVMSASLFLPKGAVVGRLRQRDQEESSLTTTTAPVHHGPLAVLVNGGTAQMAEVFTAALRGHERAIIVGVPTAGVGGITSQHEVSPSAQMHLIDTTLHSPRGAAWIGEGLTPDVVVAGSKTVMVSAHTAPPDLQYEAAIRMLDCDDK